MNIQASLRKLEKAAGVGERCLRCRVHYIRFGDEIKRTSKADLFVTTCSECGRTLKHIHSDYTGREREVLKALSTDRTLYSDAPRYLATYAWVHHLPRFLEIEEIGDAEEKRLRGDVRNPASRKQVKVLDEHAAAVKAERNSYERAQAKSKVKALDEWQEVIAELDKVRALRNTELKDQNLFSYLIMAEMEVFMWGGKSEETLRLIEDRRRHLAEEAERLGRERREREEQRERERIEREERYRREREERERQRAERSAQPTPARPMPVRQAAQPRGVEIPSLDSPAEKSKQPPAFNDAFSVSPVKRQRLPWELEDEIP